MTSQRQAEANRRNSAKSTGPRSAAGKNIASRNAVKHGLWRLTYEGPAISPEIDSLAKAFCQNSENPQVYGAAVKVAQAEIVLRRIATQKAALLKRLTTLKTVTKEQTESSDDPGKQRRDECQRLEAVNRYQRRAWAQQRRAIRNLTQVKMRAVQPTIVGAQLPNASL